MPEFIKCERCNFRYVTEKARENYLILGMDGECTLCTTCLGEITGKVMNSFGYLVDPEELSNLGTASTIPKSSLEGCRPCMKKRGLI